MKRWWIPNQANGQNVQARREDSLVVAGAWRAAMLQESSPERVYVGDVAHPYNVFHFTLNRGRDGPKYFLGDYRQILLAMAMEDMTGW